MLYHWPLSTCYALISATGHSFSYLLPILVLFVGWVWCWGPGLELGSVDLFCEKSLCESGQVAFLWGKPGGTSYCLPTSQRSLEAKVNHSSIKALRAIKSSVQLRMFDKPPLRTVFQSWMATVLCFFLSTSRGKIK